LSIFINFLVTNTSQQLENKVQSTHFSLFTESANFGTVTSRAGLLTSFIALRSNEA